MIAKIRFPGLEECIPESLGVPGVDLERVELPESPPPECPRWTPHIHGNRDEVWVEFAEAGRWRIRQGRQIEVHPHPGVPWDRILCMSMATPLGVLILQRDDLPLHAACLIRPGAAHATLLCAASGTGKSTTAAALCLRGWTILADDVTQIVEEEGTFLALPGWATIKLWPTSSDLLGFPTETLPEYPGLKEKRLWRPPQVGTNRIPVGEVLVLHREGEAAKPSLKHLRGIDAITSLREQTFRPGLIGRLDRTRTQFEHCAGLSRQASVVRLDSPSELGPQDLAEWLEKELAIQA